MVQAPKFIEDPHFYIDESGFHLREGAPPEVVAEFKEWIKYRKEAEDRGIDL